MRFGVLALTLWIAFGSRFDRNIAGQQVTDVFARNTFDAGAEVEISLDHGLLKDDSLQNAFTVYRLRIAAEVGAIESQLALGRLYRDGQYIDQDSTLAATWFYKAALSGNAEGQFLYGDLIDQKAAIKWYFLAADQGHALAQYRIALTMDYPEALPWHRKAANQGLPEAQYNLAVMYELGQGLNADQDAANAWYLKAARSGYEFAQHRLAINYEEGRGFDRDVVMAHAWYTLIMTKGRWLKEDAELRQKALRLSSRELEESRKAFQGLKLLVPNKV